MSELKENMLANKRVIRELRKMRRTLDLDLRKTRAEIKELHKTELRLIFKINKLDKAGEERGTSEKR